MCSPDVLGFKMKVCTSDGYFVTWLVGFLSLRIAWIRTIFDHCQNVLVNGNENCLLTQTPLNTWEVGLGRFTL